MFTVSLINGYHTHSNRYCGPCLSCMLLKYHSTVGTGNEFMDTPRNAMACPSTAVTVGDDGFKCTKVLAETDKHKNCSKIPKTDKTAGILNLLDGKKEGRKEENIVFNDALNTFYLRLYGIRHMVKDHSDSKRGNPLLRHGLLFPISSKEREIAQWVGYWHQVEVLYVRRRVVLTVDESYLR